MKRKVIDTEAKVDEYIINRDAACKMAEEMDKKITIYDLMIRKRIRVIGLKHGDGSYLEYESACFRKLGKEWFAIFTEHHGYAVYHFDDVAWVKEWIKPKYLYFQTEDCC